MKIEIIPMQRVAATGLEWLGILPRRKKYNCGHPSWYEQYRLSVEGVEIAPKDDSLCPACFEKWARENVILCARCQTPIFPGQGIALYEKEDCAHADIGHEEDGFYVGCTCMDCCPCGHFSGNWDGKKVVIHPSLRSEA